MRLRRPVSARLQEFNDGAPARDYDDGRKPANPKRLRFKVYKNGVHLASANSEPEAQRFADYVGGTVAR